MERTARSIVGTSSLQSNEVPYYIDNLSRIYNPVYGILRYHLLLLVNLLVFDILHMSDFILVYSLSHLP